MISNPSVGLVLETSSPHRFFTIVVLPALSRPLAGEHEGRKRGGPRHTDTRASVRSRAGDDTKPPALTGGREARGRESRWYRTSAPEARRRQGWRPWTHTMRRRISFSFALTFLITVSNPMIARLGSFAHNSERGSFPAARLDRVGNRGISGSGQVAGAGRHGGIAWEGGGEGIEINTLIEMRERKVKSH